MEVDFEAELYVWDARKADTWTFVALPPEVADEIDEVAAGRSGGFGSLRVEVTVGRTVWRTSIFPDKGAATFVLPVKRAVRRAEGVEAGDRVAVTLRLVDL
ncbi:DUF1905 domain-containing protein [Cellulomonas endophytica]|uniref:DUF1905 domain-containing protein n=1 Tax=Cellulomonas endophytica TaxID=2494735 RepID=UPI0010133402|nr:DUF1905 domain-containing protein [Cellulomonas endophytica]